MHEYIEQRDAPRNGWKLANWDAYASTVNTDDPPDAAHITIDNRLGAAVSLADQTRRTLTKLLV
ncbi:hypothetical protein [Spirillospora sp. NPDC048819]|uniref:hypothetical protein n=1 Tax=Spirillospora sp. NPDC048819 TaxID=3155268 RepID=UPI0033CC8ED6